LQHVPKAPGDDPLKLGVLGLADHRVRLAAARLPVGEDGAIVALQDVLNQRVGCLAVDEGLLRLLREDRIVGETLQIIRLLRLA
jgi:GMP synthase PP-ATPase subunit